jgi:hypothetical protein
MLRETGMLRTTGGLSGELLQFAFAIGPKRIAPLWRLLAGIAVDARRHAIEMDGAQVAVAQYCPDW